MAADLNPCITPSDPRSGVRSHDITADASRPGRRFARRNAAAWAAHDPLTVLAHHGPYHCATGLFVSGSGEPAQFRHASRLSTAARQAGIPTALTILPGGHTWKFAALAFATALPWLAAQLDLERC